MGAHERLWRAAVAPCCFSTTAQPVARSDTSKKRTVHPHGSFFIGSRYASLFESVDRFDVHGCGFVRPETAANIGDDIGDLLIGKIAFPRRHHAVVIG